MHGLWGFEALGLALGGVHLTLHLFKAEQWTPKKGKSEPMKKGIINCRK